jgi:hypothetical protein
MKIFKNHDLIALVVLFIVVLSAILMENILIKNSIQKYNESYIEYTDIDIQKISIFH